jgi:hypothetical protein
MARGLIAGGTDYSHQSLNDIITDLKEESENLSIFKKKIEDNIREVKDSNYWQNKVPYSFRHIVNYSLRHYQTSIEEINDIANEIDRNIEDHHCKRLRNIASVASEINTDIGQIWHQEYPNKEYGNQDFRKVERVYGDTRDAAVNLLDIGNMAVRLDHYVGRKKDKTMKNNPWISGLFYLFMFVIVISTISIITNYVDWWLLPMILISGTLIIGILGALQLKNDDQLRDESFIQLIVETYKKLPLLRNLTKDKK